jgi:hypothetical protein
METELWASGRPVAVRSFAGCVCGRGQGSIYLPPLRIPVESQGIILLKFTLGGPMSLLGLLAEGWVRGHIGDLN